MFLSRMVRSSSFVCALFVAVALAPSMASAQAQGDVAAAADAYTRAQQAELRGDWAEAAQLYALADQIAPTGEALRSAARAALRAGQTATAATHAAALLARESIDAESRALAEEILRNTEGDLARIRARCSEPCRVLVDGRLATTHGATSHVLFARPGQRGISASFEGGRAAAAQQVSLEAGEETSVDFAPPSASSSSGEMPPAEQGGGGLSPWIFGTAAALTAIAGGVTIWSGVDVLDAHESYDRTAPDAEAQYQHGRDLETRTNVLIAVTGSLAVATVVLAIFTDWDGEPSQTERASLRGIPLVSASDQGFLVGWTQELQ